MFWGVLIWKRKAEEALIASGIPYTVSITRLLAEGLIVYDICKRILIYLSFNLITPSAFQIVRPGGMERPTDAFKETHNITLSEEDTLFGGLVSNLQVFLT